MNAKRFSLIAILAGIATLTISPQSCRYADDADKKTTYELSQKIKVDLKTYDAIRAEIKYPVRE